MDVFERERPATAYGATVNGYPDTDVWKQLASEWYGLTPLPGDRWQTGAQCPLAVLGEKCEHTTLIGSKRRCTWNTREYARLWDHARAWSDRDGNTVITLEPYGSPFHQRGAYSRLVRDLDKLGVAVTFHGRSPYGATYSLMLTRKEGD